jgi:apolipoprotein D and lipocalin family protein
MKKILALLLLTLFAFQSFSGCSVSNNKTMDNKTVSNLDLQKYLGKWYELARFDHSFERNMVGVTATYSLKSDGKIKVVNEGYLNTLEGKYKKAVGKAKIPDKSQPGWLKVSFFLWFYADYFVLELDSDYKWALIGSSSPKYLWILSRTPQLPKQELDLILNKAKERGYDTGKLIWVDQK